MNNGSLPKEKHEVSNLGHGLINHDPDMGPKHWREGRQNK